VRTPPRRGYVLLAVMWIIAALAVSSLGMTALARRYVARAHNRLSETEAAWIAEGCIAQAHATIDAVLALRRPLESATTGSWATLDRALDQAMWKPRTVCQMTLRPTGLTLDANTVDRGTLVRLFVALGAGVPRADSLSDAIVEWRDPRGQSHAADVFDAWYADHERVSPRHGPFADVRELVGVRGMDSFDGIDSVLGIDPSRVLLDAAPLAVVRALPGFTAQAVARLSDYRAHEVPVQNLIRFAGELESDARDSLLAHYSDLVRVTTQVPDAWTLTAQAAVGDPQVTVIVEARLVPSATGAAISVRRTWIE